MALGFDLGFHLVGRDDHALDTGGSVEWRDSHEGNDGGAVRVCDDAAPAPAPQLQVSPVDLGNYERNSLCHSEGRTVVHDLSRGVKVGSQGFKV